MIDPKAGGSSGIYLEKLFEQLGIAAQMHAKEVLVPGGLVAEKLVDGSAVLALHQQSEILQVKVQSWWAVAGGHSELHRVCGGGGRAVFVRVAGRAFLTLLGKRRRAGRWWNMGWCRRLIDSLDYLLSGPLIDYSI
jgi:molybdate transport system substrate-binding protein